MRKTIFAVLLMSAAASAAAAMTLDEVMAKMENADKHINSMTFNYRQDTEYTLTREKQSIDGSVTFLKPDNLFVKQHGPLDQEITANGKKVWIYTPKYRQVVADSWKKWISSSFVPASIINFGKGYADLKKRCSVSYEGTDGGQHVLVFTPSGAENIKMKFWVDAESFIPVKLVIAGDNVTITTEMSDRVLNPVVDKKVFDFKAPPGVDVMNLP